METEVGGMIEVLRRRSEARRQNLPAGPPVLEVNDVSKRFCRDLKRSLAYGVFDIAREITGRPPIGDRLRRNEFWALRNIDFEIPRGSAVGIVGTNGCGKTTLMRVMAGLIKPTTGTITTRGRMAPLLALGAGFIQILTGRENIYTNMAVLGLTREEIDQRFQQVVDFSEIEYALDAPVQSFSSGMVARLGFACAAETQPDILLLDEVLAVGDLKFKEKCLKRLFEMKDAGTSMVLVHHSTDLLEKLCDELIYMQKGEIIARGPTSEIIARYEGDLGLEFVPKPMIDNPIGRPRVVHDQEPVETATARISRFEVVDSDSGWSIGKPAAVNLRVDVGEARARMPLRVYFYAVNNDDEVAAAPTISLTSAAAGVVIAPANAGSYDVTMRLEVLRLPQGRYVARAVALEPDETLLASRWSNSFSVAVESVRVMPREFFQEHAWEVTPVAESGVGA